MPDKYFDVKFLQHNRSLNRDSNGSRLLTILNILLGVSESSYIGLSKGEYTYRSNMKLKVDDIVLVEAQGSLALAMVTLIRNTPPNKPGIRFKNVLAKMEFPSGAIRNQKKNEILNVLFRGIPKASLETFVVDYYRKYGDENSVELLDKYDSLSRSDGVKM